MRKPVKVILLSLVAVLALTAAYDIATETEEDPSFVTDFMVGLKQGIQESRRDRLNRTEANR